MVTEGSCARVMEQQVRTRKPMTSLVMCALTTLALGQTQSPTLDVEVDKALAVAGLSRQTARFDENLLKFFRAGEFTTPLYSAVSENPWKAPFLIEVKRKDLASYAGKPNDSLLSGGGWIGWGTRRTLIGDPNSAEELLASQPNSLNKVLIDLQKDGVIQGPIKSLGSVPPQVQSAAALILATVRRAQVFRQQSMRHLKDPSWLFFTLAKGEPDDTDLITNTRLLDAYRSFPTSYMAAGAHDVLLAVQTAQAMVRDVPASATYSVTINTKWGLVRLDGGHDNTYNSEPNLLTIDTSGNDTYLNCPATRSIENGFSIVLDTRGNDKYVSDPTLLTTPVKNFNGRKTASLPGPGGAVLGTTILFDLQGNDLYRSHAMGLGAGKLGVGVLYDAGGQDTYDAYADAEGFGLFGAGILEDDGSASDVYEGFTQVQGCGMTQGFGYLVDRGGDDRYIANDDTIDFPAAQSDKHNNSMAQGAGYGRRADYLDGMSLAGGVGLLYDIAGNDQYSCAVFGQGVGYWEGVGLLWDSAGNDKYRGMWYVQGASAHFAIGYLEDLGGNDEYVATMNMAQGAGHDFSVGYLIDRSGNDSYQAPNLSLGAGNANGIGWFVDLAGDDNYVSSGWTLGKGADAPKGSLRERCLCLGVFMDLGGTNSYPNACPWAKSGEKVANWTLRQDEPFESQVGVFWDKK